MLCTCRLRDGWLAVPEFRAPQAEGGPLHSAALGRRIAVDLPHLTFHVDLECATDADPSQTQWSRGCLSEAECSVLIQSATVCLQRHLQGILCSNGYDTIAELQQRFPRVTPAKDHMLKM